MLFSVFSFRLKDLKYQSLGRESETHSAFSSLGYVKILPQSLTRHCSKRHVFCDYSTEMMLETLDRSP
jgi:hypothetical protein